MSSYVSSFSILVAVLVIVTFGVALLIVAALRTYSERRARKRNEELAEQVKKRLADLRNSPPPHQKRVDQGNNDFEDTDHEAGQRAKEATGQYTRQLQGTVGQDADQRRATEADPWATFHRGSVFDRQGQYNLAVEAYQRVLDAGDKEAAPRAAFNLGILFEEREEYDRAVEAYQRAIASEHAEWAPKAAFDLGILFEERGEYARAEEAYKEAIASEHPDAAARARLNLGVLLEQRGEYDLAEEAYKQAIVSGHPEVAPEGMRNLRGLHLRFPERIRQG
jgi:tetratricopeptide (TPR) repeat protein